MTVEQYLELKREEERLRREADRSRGALDQLHARLKSEFGIATEAEGKVLLRKLEKELARLEKEADAALADYRREFGNRMEGSK